ncbi:hypothetical protein V8G54_000619 [Vigna mungo]|uniref:Uncharacterized protein n=1 Tax=Vigna mungo TaxID=3915 RepID=A0AAQ3P6T1_VIGMU
MIILQQLELQRPQMNIQPNSESWGFRWRAQAFNPSRNILHKLLVNLMQQHLVLQHNDIYISLNIQLKVQRNRIDQVLKFLLGTGLITAIPQINFVALINKLLPLLHLIDQLLRFFSWFIQSLVKTIYLPSHRFYFFEDGMQLFQGVSELHCPVFHFPNSAQQFIKHVSNKSIQNHSHDYCTQKLIN